MPVEFVPCCAACSNLRTAHGYEWSPASGEIVQYCCEPVGFIRIRHGVFDKTEAIQIIEQHMDGLAEAILKGHI